MKLTFSQKTISGFSSLLIICLFTGLVSIYYNNQILKNFDLISDKVLSATNYLLQLDRDMHQSLVAERTLAIPSSENHEELIETAKENITQVETRWGKFKESISVFKTPKMEQSELLFEKDFTIWKNQALAAIDKLSSGNPTEFKKGSEQSLGVTAVAFEQAREQIDVQTELLEQRSDFLKLEAKKAGASARTISISVLVFSMIWGSYLTWIIGIKVSLRLKRMATDLAENADRSAESAKQINSSSNVVAQGASEQAASLEETSASIEESSSMIHSNAEAANQAQSVSNETFKVAKEGHEDMNSMVEAMQEIQDSSADISATLKTIDEIAFQTNILALNAAVEAARAGDAGAGFSVVADEVRALAQRCATAAKETSTRIEESVHRSNRGMETSKRVSEKLSNILEKAEEMEQLISSIATGSKEQSLGIQQINDSMSKMEEVTQGNAAAAEETAATANELDNQVSNLYQVISNLTSLIGTNELAKPHAQSAAKGFTINKTFEPSPQPQYPTPFTPDRNNETPLTFIDH